MCEYESMDPDTEITFREEIARIVHFLVEFYRRFREGNEEEIFFLRWRPACLRRDGRHKSVVRWLGNRLPRGLADSCKAFNYRNLLGSVFTTRSLVREIGSRLPLQPSKRPYFYMLHKPVAEMCSTRLKGSSSTRFVHSTPCRNRTSPNSIVWQGNNESYQENTLNQSSAVVTADTAQKITALEDELNRLRAQIAGFVLNQEDTTATTVTPPSLVPPPPPPPPPPLPSVTSSIHVPQTTKKKAAVSKDGSVMDMTAILKDLNQVKLKAVERSPGGTPVRRAPRRTKGTDPASIIADALKSKFAKSRMAVASPDKENIHSNSPGNSFSNTPSPQPHFRKPLSQACQNERSASNVEVKCHAIPLRV